MKAQKINSTLLGFSLGLIFAVFLSCNKPSSVTINKEEMAKIIIDLQILESQMGRITFQNADSVKVVYKTLEKDIWKKHKTDSLTFAKNFNILAENSEELKKVYALAEKIVSKNLEKTPIK